MAKLSIIARDKKKERLVTRYKTKRQTLKQAVTGPRWTSYHAVLLRYVSTAVVS